MCQNSISKLFKRPWCFSVLQEVVSNRISRKFGEQEVLNKLSSWAAFDFWCCQSSHHLISSRPPAYWFGLLPRSDSRATTPANWIRFGVWSYLGPILAWWGLPEKSPHIIPIFRFVSCKRVRPKCRGILWAANQSKDGFVWKSQTVAL